MQHNDEQAEHKFPIRARPADYITAAGIVLVTTGVAFVVDRLIPHATLSLVFLTGVLIVSVRTGLGPSLVASLLSFLSYNFFFTSPHYTFEVADDTDVTTLVFFLIIAGITGNLAARMHQEMAKRQVSLQRMSNLYQFGRRMLSVTGTDAVLDVLSSHLAQSVQCPVAVILVKPDGMFEIHRSDKQGIELPEDNIRKALSLETSEPVSIDSWHFIKLITQHIPMGLVAIQGPHLDNEKIELARGLCDQAAVSLERTQLASDLEQARLLTETEQLRSALLSSISHDLRTPLASIIGSTTSLIEYGSSFSEDNRHELLRMIAEEAQRLDRYIQNLLDMTRLGHGKLTLHRDWVDINDIVSSAIDRMRDTLKGLVLDIDIPADLPLIRVHGILIEQALFNLLDNAARFSPEHGRISLTARASESSIEIDLCDEGPGIPVDEREKIFDMFYTASQGDRGKRQGTGLGLAICRGMVGAHGGSVTAHDGINGRGTCMRIMLPLNQAD